jgi:hypothetical protein
LTRNYDIVQRLGAVSGRELRQEMGAPAEYGAAVSREGGQEALRELVEHMVRDAHWIYLDDYRLLARAEADLKRYREAADPLVSRRTRPAPPAERPTPYRRYRASPSVALDSQAGPQTMSEEIAARLLPEPGEAGEELPPPTLAEMAAEAKAVLPLLRRLAFSPEEASVLTDGYLEADKRAGIVNAMRARSRGLDGPEDLEPGQRLDAEAAEALYDSPAVARSVVEAALAERALILCLGVLTPEPGEEQQGLAAGLRQGLSSQLAARLRGKPHLQAMLLQRADRAVASAWPAMRSLLRQVGSPLTEEYLARRGS